MQRNVMDALSVSQRFAEAAEARKAEAERAVRETVAGCKSNKIKKSRLKAAMEKTEAELRDANRKLPRSERESSLQNAPRWYVCFL